jgi:hypothetical protein
LAAQGPVGNGDGNIDPAEFMQLWTSAIRDENADGNYDRLDPALDFVIASMTKQDGVTAISWNSVPARTYQLEYANQLSGEWLPLGSQKTAGPGELILSQDDSSASPARFYRVRLVNP